MMRILVVEDDLFITTIFSMFIKSLGHQLVAHCKSGKEALEACRLYNPDVILMDIHIEGELDGIVTCQLIHEEFDIPVIYVSSETDNHVIENAVTSNSYGYLVKPITKQELGISLDLAFYKHKIDAEHRANLVQEKELIVETSLAIVIVSRGRITYLNKYALEFFKPLEAEEILSSPFINYLNENLKEEVQALIDKPFQNSRWTKELSGALNIEANTTWVELIASEVSFGGTRVLQFVIKHPSCDLEPITYVNVMKKALMNYPRLCLLLSEDIDIYSYNKVYSIMSADEQLQLSNFLYNADLQKLCEGKDEIKIQYNSANGLMWLKIFVARNGNGEPMEYVVIEVD